MERQTIAYLLIALIALFFAGFAIYKFHYGRGRSYQRRIRKEQADHAEAMAEPRSRPDGEPR